MDFKFTDGQQMLRDVAAQFAENELEPIAAELDLEHRFPKESF